MAKKTAVTTSESEKVPAAKKVAKKAAARAKSATKSAASKVSAESAADNNTELKNAETTTENQVNAGTIAIRALVDVGFGNHLYIRGDGAGLSWDVGQPMACLGAQEWQWTTSSAVRPVPFKVLVNDQIWSVGDDYIATPGEITVVEPGF